MSIVPSHDSSYQAVKVDERSNRAGRDDVRPRKSPGTALYRQVADDLLAQVAREELMPGERLEPEAQLARRYGVNRLTVRRALEELARAGVLRTEHGVGSFVAVPPMRHRIDDGQASLSESMAGRGIGVRHRVLAVEPLDPAPATLFPDFPAAIVRFHFVRYLEDEPWSIGEVIVPASIAPLDWDGSTSVFAPISERHGLTVRRTERGFSAGPATPLEAAWLEVPVGAALLVLRGLNTDQHGRAIATVCHHIRGDRAEYVVRLAPSASSTDPAPASDRRTA
jgi:DNA-binding GntR family transcriptional regulator